MKIFNWIFSSFFRTLGRFLFYIVVGFIAMLFISGKVNAAEMNPRYATVNGTYLWSDGKIQSAGKIEYGIVNNSNAKINFCIAPDYYASNDSNVTNKYYFGFIETCTTGYTGLDGWWQSSGTGYGLMTGWLDTTDVCYTKDGYPGHKQKVYFQLVDFTTPSGGADFSWSCFQLANDNANSNYYNIGRITNIILTDKDYYTEDKLKQEEINRENQSLNNQQTQINQNDTIINQNNATNDKLDEQLQQDKNQHNETMNTITSDEMPDLDFDVVGWLPQGSIDSLINLPLTLLNSMNNQVGASCSPYQLPYIGGSTISIPCIGNYLSNLSGWSYLIDTLDIFMGVILIYKLLMSLYKDVQKILSLKENDDELGGIE